MTVSTGSKPIFTKDATTPADVIAQAETFLTPLAKVNQKLVANLNALVTFQLGLLNDYTHIGLSRLADASKISGSDGMMVYINASSQIYKDLFAKLQDDTQALYALLTDVHAEVEKAVSDAAVELAPEAAKADVHKMADAQVKVEKAVSDTVDETRADARKVTDAATRAADRKPGSVT